ncbi:MAG: hypothetical protein AABX79_00550 [Nanoarchaeota archaeon]
MALPQIHFERCGGDGFFLGDIDTLRSDLEKIVQMEPPPEVKIKAKKYDGRITYIKIDVKEGNPFSYGVHYLVEDHEAQDTRSLGFKRFSSGNLAELSTTKQPLAEQAAAEPIIIGNS